MERQNIILSDCEEEEIEELREALKEVTDQEFIIKQKLCNGTHNRRGNIYRYFIYLTYPVKFFLRRKEYKVIIGWQQFFAIFFCFFCRVFKVKKQNIVVALNFTYKSKKGLAGKIYEKIMRYCIENEYLDYIHVPSINYANKCAEEFNIPMTKFIITTFGIVDTYEKWKKSNVEYNDYVLAIGRSNRDYDFLIEVWKKLPNKCKLVIICDEYNMNKEIPSNVTIRKDIVGDKQFPYIINCKLMIIPIENAEICSGDTVLLTAMSYSKTVIVTKPSTLSEMYIENEKNGICIEKDVKRFSEYLGSLLYDNEKLDEIGKNAKKSFIEKYSRYNMGIKIGNIIKVDIED